MSAGDGTAAVAESSAISLPHGGGAVGGLGETFAAELCTGTGNFTVPIAVPPGRNGLAPALTLKYAAGHGNGPVGLDWSLTLPRLSRKTSRGVPRYADTDTYVLGGAEDLVRVSGGYPGRVRYRPRTEGSFARIEHVRDAGGDEWEVRERDGTRSRYATTLAGPAGIFAWAVTETTDPLGNRIRYHYREGGGPLLVSRIQYADYGDPAAPSFLVSVDFEYEDRPDPHTDCRAGFPIRTALRCRLIRVATHAADGVTRVQREYRLSYQQAPFNGVSLLSRVDVIGVDETDGVRREEPQPPVTFEYTGFDPGRRRFTGVTGVGLPTVPWSDPDLALVDLRGTGLPDVVQLGTARRYWVNRGGGRFDPPRTMGDAPPHALSEPGVRFLDADGDGRIDLLVTAGDRAGYYPLTFAGRWSRRSFRGYRQAPSVALADPAVRLVDLDGDGLTDVLRSGSRLECWFNDVDPRLAWKRTAVGSGPAVDLADPHTRLADMTGDGLQDIVRVQDGSIEYWPNLGHGRWGETVRMRQAPRLPLGYDPNRLLLGDVDGDGAADLVYVDRDRVLVWGNRTGSGWTDQPVVIGGTPGLAGGDDVRLVDLHGTGMAGLLWSSTRGGPRYLDLTGGGKPYLLSTMDNHLGARTTVRYRPSTEDFLRDQADPATRWRTTLPFPVQVVASVEVRDLLSGGRLVTEYRYHHGYWDGVEREFRGFATVEQLDAERVVGTDSPRTLTRQWFHIGPVAAAEATDWVELDLRHEYWDGDAPILTRPAATAELLGRLSRTDRRSALRTLRGQLLRTELYALDGTEREHRPYAVTEYLAGIREESPGVYFPFAVGERNTRYERGDDPMTQLAVTTRYDGYGLATGQLAVAVPRGRDPLWTVTAPAEPYLATFTETTYAQRDDLGLVDRVSQRTTSEVVNDGRLSVPALIDAVIAGTVALQTFGRTRTYYDGPAFLGLPLGEVGPYGLPSRTETLAFTADFLTDPPPYLSAGGWTDDYPVEFRGLVPELAGYTYDGGGYYTVDTRRRYDTHDPTRVSRGLPLASLDPLGHECRVGYDAHDLYPVLTTDPAGLPTRAQYDYRVLRPRAVTDVNGNTSSVTFSPLGLVTERYLRGADGQGDVLMPSIRLDYQLLAFAAWGQPASVRTTRRVHHDNQAGVPTEERDAVVVTVEYFDGLGRPLQTRALAEDTLFGDPVFGGGVLPADQSAPVPPVVGRTRQPGEPENVIVSGWQVYDHKGRVVHRYEPFFATGWDFAPPGEAERGQRATMRYDPRGVPVRTVYPDGSEQRVVLGVPVDVTDPDRYRPTPWETFTYDNNDNAGRTHRAVAQTYVNHWNTPASAEVDALGRQVSTVVRTGPDPDRDALIVLTRYDIRGNRTEVVDAAGRVAFRYRYDLAGRCWRTEGIDAGVRTTVFDAAGNPLEARDGKGALRLTGYDGLRRPVRVWARDIATGPVTLRQVLEYGDGGAGQPAAERAAAAAHNLLGRVVRHYDEAGLVTVSDVDLAGNVIETTRLVIADALVLSSYTDAPAEGWAVRPFVVDWTVPPGGTRADREAALLEPTGYQTSTRFDALGRVVRHTLPLDVEGQRRVLRPRYNRAGGLDRILLDDTVYVHRIGYDAKGQRTLVEYGNGVTTRHAYHPATFRLVRTLSEAGPVLQDQAYRHDLVGNVLAIHDRTPGSGLPASPDAFDRWFGYDPLYRLLSATGREYDLALDGPPWTDVPRGDDPTRTRPYTETYRYDDVGSLLRLAHASAGGYTREFTVDPASNRVTRMTVGATPFDYTYDANGNRLGETLTRRYDWDHADRLAAFGVQTPGAEPSVHAQYLYDAAGRRVKKLVRKQGGAVEVTHYLGDVFEHHRWSAGENNHVHVLDSQRRIALVRLGSAYPGDQGPAVTYHLADHLGSSTTTVDGAGVMVSREEFTPYGETSFGGHARKRYRYTGKERDEESGLTYHGARYYAPWTGTWTATDPSGIAGGLHQYRYCDSNPVAYVDRNGRDFTAVFDFDNSRVTLHSVFFVNTAAEERQLTAAARAFHQATSQYRGWQVSFDISIHRLDLPRGENNQPVNHQVFRGLIKGVPNLNDPRVKVISPMANFYGNAANPAVPRNNVEGNSFIGGMTRAAHNIVMYHHEKYGDMGEYIDAVKHEVAHTFGLDDKHAGPEGRYWVKNVITDYDFLTRLRDGASPKGFDRAGIGTAVTNRIMDFVYDYDPNVHRPGPGHIPNTPRITVMSIEGGQRREFGTFDAMWADHTNRTVNRLLESITP